MIRSFALALLVVACTQARTDGVAASSAPNQIAPPAVQKPPQPGRDPSRAPAVAGSNSAPDVRKVSDDGKGAIEQYVDLTPVPREHSPADDLAKQVGGSNQPAQGGRSLAMVKGKTVLGPPSSLDVGSMELDYVRRGQRDVKRCFDTLRAKDPAAEGGVTLRFTVDTKGAVVDPEVTGFNAELSTCIQASMKQWKFTAPNRPSRFELILKLVVG